MIPISANVANSNTSERIRLNDKKLDKVRYFVILLSFGSHGCLVFLLHDISDTFSPQKVNLLTLQLWTEKLQLDSGLIVNLSNRKQGDQRFNGFDFCLWLQSVPLYLSEMAPYKYRGALNIGFQLSITAGILIANVLNYFFVKIHGGWGWRLSLGGAMVPALIITVGSLVLPDTPNSMIERGQHDEAREKLKRVRGVDDVDEEFNDLVAASEASKKVEHSWKNLLQRKYRPHVAMAVMIPFFQQLTGINVIMFYAPVLFNTIGFGNDAALMSAVITGIVNVVATMVSIYGVDKWGRRFLFLEGGCQMLICQVIDLFTQEINFFRAVVL